MTVIPRSPPMAAVRSGELGMSRPDDRRGGGGSAGIIGLPFRRSLPGPVGSVLWSVPTGHIGRLLGYVDSDGLVLGDWQDGHALLGEDLFRTLHASADFGEHVHERLHHRRREE